MKTETKKIHMKSLNTLNKVSDNSNRITITANHRSCIYLTMRSAPSTKLAKNLKILIYFNEIIIYTIDIKKY